MSHILGDTYFGACQACCASLKIKIWTKRPFIGQTCLCPSKKDYFQWVERFRPKPSKFQALKEHLKCIWQRGPRAFNRNTKACGCRVFHYLRRTNFGRQSISLNMWTVKSCRTEKWQGFFCICIAHNSPGLLLQDAVLKMINK